MFAGPPWHSQARSCITPSNFCLFSRGQMCPWVFVFSLEGTSHWIRSHFNPVWHHINYICKEYFQIRVSFFSFLIFFNIQLTNDNLIYLKCTTRWLDICIHCERVPTNPLTYLLSHILFFNFIWWKHLNSTFLANFNCTMILLTVIILCIWSSDTLYSFTLLPRSLYCPQSSASDKHHPTLYFYEFDFFFEFPLMHDIMQHVSLCVWFTSLSTMSSWFTHFVANGKMPFFFHGWRFLILVIVNNVAMNIGVKIDLFKGVISLPLYRVGQN